MGSADGWLIGVHAAAGVVCFVTGAVSMRRPAARSGWLPGFVWSLLVMAVAVAAAVAVGWSSIGTVTRVVYAVLLGLAAYMVWRGGRALWLARRRPAGWKRRYLDHVGFVLISLFDGFVIVAAIDLGTPGWVVAAVAVAGIAVGVALVNREKVRHGPADDGVAS